MMRIIFWFLLFVAFSSNTVAQHSLIYDVPNTTELLKQNKISEIHVFEKMDSVMKLTGKFYIDESGYANEHWYLDPYRTEGNYHIEKSRRSKDTAGLVVYTGGLYTEDGQLIKIIRKSNNWYSRNKRLLKYEIWEDLGYSVVRTMEFDTLHPAYENRSELRLDAAGDTMIWIKDTYDEIYRIHSLKTKVNGKWEDTERSVMEYRNGEYISYKIYKKGKLVQEEFPSDKTDGPVGFLDEEEFGLPVPEPYIDTFYSNTASCDKTKTVSSKKAKFRVLNHHENGYGHDLSYYEVFDNASGLILVRSAPGDHYRSEFKYISRK